MKKIYVPLFVLLLINAGCNNSQTLKEKQAEVSTGKIDESFKYTCNEVGWQTSLPRDWNLLTQKETQKMNENGKAAMEKTAGTSIDISGLRELVNLKKDVYNSFLSTIEKYDTNGTGSFADHNLAVENLVKNTYRDKKIKFDSKVGSEQIDHIDFHTMEINIYAPNSDKIILTQKLYSTLLKGYEFAMTINYNNADDKRTLMKIVMGSRFL